MTWSLNCSSRFWLWISENQCCAREYKQPEDAFNVMLQINAGLLKPCSQISGWPIYQWNRSGCRATCRNQDASLATHKLYEVPATWRPQQCQQDKQQQTSGFPSPQHVRIPYEPQMPMLSFCLILMKSRPLERKPGNLHLQGFRHTGERKCGAWRMAANSLTFFSPRRVLPGFVIYLD